MTEIEHDDLNEVTPNEIEKVEPIEIIDKTEKKNPTSEDTDNPYDSMDNTDEEIAAYMEDINAQ